MSMQALRSAAHAAGYAMAPEDLPECRPQAVRRTGTALVVRSRPASLRLSLRLLRTQRYLRRLWVSEWVAGHWPGRATA
jgi:hypothetical protein